MKNLAFLAVGVAVGFVLANLVQKSREKEQDPNALAESIETQLELLEGLHA